MGNKTKDRRRLLWINLMIALAVLLLVAGLLSLAIRPDATQYVGWLFSGACFTIAFLMIRRKVLRRLGK